MASRTPRAATARSSGHQCAPPKGRVCCPHPIGDSHAGHALVTRRPAWSTVPSMLPMPLSANAIPRAPAAMPAAPRVVEDSWQVTAATPTHTSPTAATDAPASSAPSSRLPADRDAGTEHQGEDDVGGHGDEDAGGQAGVATDDGGAEHLGAAELLVLAGVPDHREGAHQCGEHRQGDVLAVQHVAADAGSGGEPEQCACRRWSPPSGSPARGPRAGRGSARTSPSSRPRTGPALPTTRGGCSGRGAPPGGSGAGCR